MKAKTVISGILSCLLLFTALAACGKGEGQKEPNVESSQVQQIEEEPGKHLLYVYDAG